jgi:hypothetical protein
LVVVGGLWVVALPPVDEAEVVQRIGFVGLLAVSSGFGWFGPGVAG